MAKHSEMGNAFSTPIWVERITNLLEEQGMTQQELAQKSGVTPSTISDWIGFKKKGRSQREPKITGFKAVADILGVSTDYLLGADDCTTPMNEEIHKKTGLSDKAIKNLIRIQRSVKAGEVPAAKKLAACNFLLEAINSTELFDSLYSYLLGEFHFRNGKADLGADVIYSKEPIGEESEMLVFAENYSHVYLSKVLQELSLLKKTTDKTKSKKEKVTYEEWEKTPYGIAFEMDNLAQQPDFDEEDKA